MIDLFKYAQQKKLKIYCLSNDFVIVSAESWFKGRSVYDTNIPKAIVKWEKCDNENNFDTSVIEKLMKKKHED